MDSKTCTKCHTEKPKKKFSLSKRYRDGLQQWCKECRSELGKEYKKTDKYRRYAKEYQKQRNKRDDIREDRNRRARDFHAKAHKELSAAYIKRLLRRTHRIPAALVTPELIELKRAQQEARRFSKQLRKGIEDESIENGS